MGIGGMSEPSSSPRHHDRLLLLEANCFFSKQLGLWAASSLSYPISTLLLLLFAVISSLTYIIHNSSLSQLSSRLLGQVLLLSPNSSLSQLLLPTSYLTHKPSISLETFENPEGLHGRWSPCARLNVPSHSPSSLRLFWMECVVRNFQLQSWIARGTQTNMNNLPRSHCNELSNHRCTCLGSFPGPRNLRYTICKIRCARRLAGCPLIRELIQ